MKLFTLNITLFACFAFGLPVWLMQNNQYDYPSVHGCTGDCYTQWLEDTGGVVAMAKASAAAKAAASPVELGQTAYVGCVACHGARGEGGLGPMLAGQSTAQLVEKLLAYKKGETRGSQSNLMWGQAAGLSDSDIDNLAAYIESF